MPPQPQVNSGAHNTVSEQEEEQVSSRAPLSNATSKGQQFAAIIVDPPDDHLRERRALHSYSLEDRLDILFGHKKSPTPYPSETQISSALFEGQRMQQRESMLRRSRVQKRSPPDETSSHADRRRHTREVHWPHNSGTRRRNTSDPLAGKRESKAGVRRQRYRREVGYLSRYPVFDPVQFDRVEQMMEHKDKVTEKNCEELNDEELELPVDVNYGSDYFFENHAHSALRLSHFLSAFLQIADADEMYGFYLGDKRLNQHQLYAEVFELCFNLEILKI